MPSGTITLEFQDFSRVFQDLCLLPWLSRPGNISILIPELSRVCTCGPAGHQQVRVRMRLRIMVKD